VLDFHQLRSLKLQRSVGEKGAAAEQVVAGESSEELNEGADKAIARELGIVVWVAVVERLDCVKRLDCVATTFELFAIDLK